MSQTLGEILPNVVRRYGDRTVLIVNDGSTQQQRSLRQRVAVGSSVRWLCVHLMAGIGDAYGAGIIGHDGWIGAGGVDRW